MNHLKIDAGTLSVTTAFGGGCPSPDIGRHPCCCGVLALPELGAGLGIGFGRRLFLAGLRPAPGTLLGSHGQVGWAIAPARAPIRVCRTLGSGLGPEPVLRRSRVTHGSPSRAF